MLLLHVFAVFGLWLLQARVRHADAVAQEHQAAMKGMAGRGNKLDMANLFGSVDLLSSFLQVRRVLEQTNLPFKLTTAMFLR